MEFVGTKRRICLRRIVLFIGQNEVRVFFLEVIVGF
jgi:hypothetical protein